MSNQRHLPVLVFEIELIPKKKNEQRRAAKGNKRQMKTLTKNRNEQQEAFFIPIFIQLGTNKRWLTSKAMKNQKKQKRALKSNKSQQKAKTNIVV